jgi:GNAT superfamily N-acetyltransferase
MPLRLASTADVDDLVGIHPIFAPDHVQNASIQDRVERGQCVLSISEPSIDGVLMRQPRHFYDRDFIDLLMVTPAARRRGVGSDLMRWAVTQSTTSQIFTSTNRSNEPMQALLGSLGWHLSGELDGLDPGDPELVYYFWRHPAG